MKYKITGIIVSNTSDSNRENLSDLQKNEIGGLSGKPIKIYLQILLRNFIVRQRERFKL